MKRLSAVVSVCLLFSAAFVVAKGRAPEPAPLQPDTLSSVWLYTEAVKQNAIFRDTARARELLCQAIRRDSSFAPAYYELGVNGFYRSPDEALALARAAYRLDSTDKWYQQFFGQALLYARRYDEALDHYRRMMKLRPDEPENYRVVAALYEQRRSPVMALVTLDSAEVRFGRIAPLSEMKRHLLVATNQTDRAIREAREMVAEAPYEADRHVILANLYAGDGQDSLARAEFAKALSIDSADVRTLMALSDFYTDRRDYHALLSVMRPLFQSDELPLETKIRRFEQFTSDMRFYREYYFLINDLASTLAIRYPDDPRVVKLYAGHLIASGELPRALELYKNHLGDQPPVADYFRAVIDIEGFLQRPDSVDKYVDRALALFPGKIDFHIAKGNVLSYGRHFDRAIDAYETALDHAPSDSVRSVIWGLIGDTWHQKALLGDRPRTPADTLATATDDILPPTSAARKAMKQCYKAYEKSLGLWDQNIVVLNNYAYFLSLEGRDLERALAMSSLVVALTDNNPTYLDTHAWVLFKLGRLEEAKKLLQKAVALDARQSPELMVHYGDILHLLGEQFMAEIYWQQALEKGYNARQIERRMAQPARPKSETQAP